IHVTPFETELHLVADRNRPMDFEIYSVERLQAIGAGGETITQILPFYSAGHGTERGGPLAYYTLQRRPRLLSTRQQQAGGRAGYLGSECFLSLVDSARRQVTGEIRQIDAHAICSNRDLPIQLALGQGRSDFLIEGGAPVEAVRCISGPSYPRSSP